MAESNRDAPRHEPSQVLNKTTGAAPKVDSKEDHFKAIRGHIADLTKTGDQTLKNALGKIIVRLDRIEGK